MSKTTECRRFGKVSLQEALKRDLQKLQFNEFDRNEIKSV